jgi:hypothetical protein
MRCIQFLFKIRCDSIQVLFPCLLEVLICLIPTHNVLFVCRLPSALGLEQPGDATDARAPEPEKVVDVTPVAMEVVEPSQQADAHVPSPIEAEVAGEGDVPIAKPEPVNVEQPQENPIGRLR